MSNNIYSWGQTQEATAWGLSTENEMALLVASDDLVEEFERLSEQWRTETASVSSLEKRYAHPAYQRIIGLGPDAVPILLSDLEAKPNFWFHALRSITGENPVAPEIRGNVRAMTEAWLAWGRAQGYLD